MKISLPLSLPLLLIFSSQLLFSQVKYETIFENATTEQAMLFCDDGGQYLFRKCYGEFSDPIIKIDSNGHVQWSNQLYRTGDLGTELNGYALTADQGLLIAGSLLNPFGDDHAMIMKLNSQGIFEWGKVDSYQYSFKTILRLNNSYLVLSDAGNQDTIAYMIIKFTETGDIIWQKKVYLPDVPVPTYCSLAQLKTHQLSNNRWALIDGQVIAVFDSSANYVSAYTISFPTINWSIKPASNNSILIGAWNWDTHLPVFFKLDSSGALVFSKEYSNGIEVDDMEEMDNGDFFFVASDLVQNTLQGYIVRTDPAGNVLWCKEEYFADADYAPVSLRKSNGNLYLLSSVEFYYGYLFNSYLLVTDENFSLPSCYNNMVISASDYTVDFSSVTLELTLVTNDPLDSFSGIQSIPYPPVEIAPCFATAVSQPVIQKLSYSVNPNPFDGETTLQISSPFKDKVTVTVTDIFSRVRQQLVTDPNTSIGLHLERANEKIFFINITQGEAHKIIKVIKK